MLALPENIYSIWKAFSWQRSNFPLFLRYEVNGRGEKRNSKGMAIWGQRGTIREAGNYDFDGYTLHMSMINTYLLS
jgi:hypothetical protein